MYQGDTREWPRDLGTQSHILGNDRQRAQRGEDHQREEPVKIEEEANDRSIGHVENEATSQSKTDAIIILGQFN